MDGESISTESTYNGEMHRNTETECNIVIILEDIHFLRFLAKKTFLVRENNQLAEKRGS